MGSQSEVWPPAHPRGGLLSDGETRAGEYGTCEAGRVHHQRVQGDREIQHDGQQLPDPEHQHADARVDPQQSGDPPRGGAVDRHRHRAPRDAGPVDGRGGHHPPLCGPQPSETETNIRGLPTRTNIQSGKENTFIDN